MTIRKINGTTVEINGTKLGVKDGQVKLPNAKKFVPVENVLGQLSKGEARRLRKMLAAIGESKMAAAKRQAA